MTIDMRHRTNAQGICKKHFTRTPNHLNADRSLLGPRQFDRFSAHDFRERAVFKWWGQHKAIDQHENLRDRAFGNAAGGVEQQCVVGAGGVSLAAREDVVEIV